MSIEANNLAGPGDETRIVELAFMFALSRFVMDTARLFCRRGSRDGGAAKGLQRMRNEQRNPTVRASTGAFLASSLWLATPNR